MKVLGVIQECTFSLFLRVHVVRSYTIHIDTTLFVSCKRYCFRPCVLFDTLETEWTLFLLVFWASKIEGTEWVYLFFLSFFPKRLSVSGPWTWVTLKLKILFTYLLKGVVEWWRSYPEIIYRHLMLILRHSVSVVNSSVILVDFCYPSLFLL